MSGTMHSCGASQGNEWMKNLKDAYKQQAQLMLRHLAIQTDNKISDSGRLANTNHNMTTVFKFY